MTATATGTHRVILVEVSGGSGGPGVSWLRRIAADWWRTHGEPAPCVATATAYLDEPAQWHWSRGIGTRPRGGDDGRRTR